MKLPANLVVGVFLCVLFSYSVGGCYATDLSEEEMLEIQQGIDAAYRSLEEGDRLAQDCPDGLESETDTCLEKWQSFYKEYPYYEKNKEWRARIEDETQKQYEESCSSYLHGTGKAFVDAASKLSIAQMERCVREHYRSMYR